VKRLRVVTARPFGVVLGLVLAVSSSTACKRAATVAVQDAGAGPAPVRASSEGLLLTWIDDKGDFHVETRVADVPMMGRDTVRVVDPAKDDPSGNGQIMVVDLRQTLADGTYPVRSMARSEFDALAVARREQKGPTLANADPPVPSDPPPSAPSAEAPPAKPSARGVVVIYGAEWCGACHDAARYLRHKGIAYVEKDIEKDAVAAREMQDKLAKNGLRGGSIPVIDVRGKVMVGFNAAEIDGALGDPL
jgi:glutaredoxin